MRLGEADELAQGSVPSAYKYRAWRLSDAITLVARCELNGVQDAKGGADQKLLIRALTEFDSKVTGMDWRAKIETQRGAVIATELKNNANKLAKWTACALRSTATIRGPAVRVTLLGTCTRGLGWPALKACPRTPSRLRLGARAVSALARRARARATPSGGGRRAGSCSAR